MWVKLPNSPMELWSTAVLKVVGDNVGKFINTCIDYHSKVDKKGHKNFSGIRQCGGASGRN
jgi:hypothetical protein